jgi:hypothetical protein
LVNPDAQLLQAFTNPPLPPPANAWDALSVCTLVAADAKQHQQQQSNDAGLAIQHLDVLACALRRVDDTDDMVLSADEAQPWIALFEALEPAILSALTSSSSDDDDDDDIGSNVAAARIIGRLLTSPALAPRFAATLLTGGGQLYDVLSVVFASSSSSSSSQPTQSVLGRLLCNVANISTSYASAVAAMLAQFKSEHAGAFAASALLQQLSAIVDAVSEPTTATTITTTAAAAAAAATGTVNE